MPTDDEVIELARSVSTGHTPDEIALAGWLHVSDQAFARACARYGVAYGPMLAMRDRCVRAFMTQQGITPSRLQSARQAIERADSTMRYLDAIPK